MSADNWAMCPQCREKAISEVERKEKLVASKYGKIPIENYEAMKGEAQSMRAALNKREETFREDWELGMVGDSFQFYVSYSGSCGVCGLSFSFKHEVNDIRTRAKQ